MTTTLDDTTSAGLRTAINQKKEGLRAGLVEYSAGGQRRPYPWRVPHVSPYEVLIAEVLLKRTTATAAANAYVGFLVRFPSIQALNKAPQEDVADALSSVGLQQQRARSLKAMAKHLVEREQGQIPNDLQQLLRVPGVGHYSARAVLSFAFGIPSAIVDSNVERVFQRLFLYSLPNRPALSLHQTIADSILPTEQHREFNWGMLDLAALVCRPALPRCSECPLTNVCDYYYASLPRTEAQTNIGPAGTRAPIQAVDRVSRLRAARKERGLSLVLLSKLSGVSKLTIIKIEGGRTSPKPTTLQKLAQVLDISPVDLREQPDVGDGVPL